MDLSFDADVLAYATLVVVAIAFGIVAGLASRAADRSHRWTDR